MLALGLNAVLFFLHSETVQTYSRLMKESRLRDCGEATIVIKKKTGYSRLSSVPLIQLADILKIIIINTPFYCMHLINTRPVVCLADVFIVVNVNNIVQTSK